MQHQRNEDITSKNDHVYGVFGAYERVTVSHGCCGLNQQGI